MHKEVYLLANVVSSWVVHQSNHSEIIKLDNLQDKIRDKNLIIFIKPLTN